MLGAELMVCELQKLAFPYEWFDSFEKLNHIGPVKYEEFYSSLKGGITISQEEYQNFCDEFHKRGCVTMKDWLKEYNLADVEPFIEALEKTSEQYYPDENDLLKDAVSILGISMTYVLNKALKRKNIQNQIFLLPGNPAKCECSSDDCQKKGCEKCKEIRDNCEICTKNEAYENADNRNDRRPFYRILQTCRSWSFKDQISYIQRSGRKNLPISSGP